MTIWLLYTAVTVSIQRSSGIPYADWFKTAPAAWRAGVLSLAAGSVLLVVLWRLLRWDHLWRDPVRLPTSGVMKAAMIFWCAAVVLRFAGIEWGRVPADLLVAILVSGTLVGFAEELAFRGFFLRAMRAGGRSEAAAATWTALAFGLFHLPNAFMGTGWIGSVQVLLAAASGIVLYAFRRHFGVIWPAMLAHGVWDVSTFLAGGYGRSWLAVSSLWMVPASFVLGLCVFASVWRRQAR